MNFKLCASKLIHRRFELCMRIVLNDLNFFFIQNISFFPLIFSIKKNIFQSISGKKQQVLQRPHIQKMLLNFQFQIHSVHHTRTRQSCPPLASRSSSHKIFCYKIYFQIRNSHLKKIICYQPVNSSISAQQFSETTDEHGPFRDFPRQPRWRRLVTDYRQNEFDLWRENSKAIVFSTMKLFFLEI